MVGSCGLPRGGVESLVDDVIASGRCKCERLLVIRSAEIYPTFLRFVYFSEGSVPDRRFAFMHFDLQKVEVSRPRREIGAPVDN